MQVVIQGSDDCQEARVSRVEVVIQGSDDFQKARVSRVQVVIQGSGNFQGAGWNSEHRWLHASSLNREQDFQ